MCINKDDKDKKHDEIRQIYSNAYCTIVLVPELQAYPPKPIDGSFSWDTRYGLDQSSILETQWMSRIRSLEETIMSSEILFIGRNAHIWLYQTSDVTCPIFGKNPVYTTATILHFAHTHQRQKSTTTYLHLLIFFLTL